jgi:predicted transport protein
LESIFAVLISSKKEVKVRIRYEPDMFKGPKESVEEVHKRWFFTQGRGQEIEFRIRDKGQIDLAMELIRHSYEISG